MANLTFHPSSFGHPLLSAGKTTSPISPKNGILFASPFFIFIGERKCPAVATNELSFYRCSEPLTSAINWPLPNPMSDQPTYPPSDDFISHAQVQGPDAYRALREQAQVDPNQFWSQLAAQELHWFQPFTKGLEWNPPFAKWFAGGKINASYNCLDRHLATDRKNKVAILLEGEPGDQRGISYQELHRLVCRFANVLKGRGCKAGDRAIIYMGMVPELPVALLACARLGVIHSVVFGGFSAEALKARIQDLEAQVVITGRWRLAARQGSAPQGRGGRSARRLPRRAAT